MFDFFSIIEYIFGSHLLNSSIQVMTTDKWFLPLVGPERLKMSKRTDAALTETQAAILQVILKSKSTRGIIPSMREIADLVGSGKSQVSDDVNADVSGHLTEDLLREAAADLPIDADAIVEEIRQERIFATWTDDEHRPELAEDPETD